MPSLETDILEAALDEDREAVIQKLRRLLPDKRKRLRTCLYWLIALIDDEEWRSASTTKPLVP